MSTESQSKAPGGTPDPAPNSLSGNAAEGRAPLTVRADQDRLGYWQTEDSFADSRPSGVRDVWLRLGESPMGFAYLLGGALLLLLLTRGVLALFFGGDEPVPPVPALAQTSAEQQLGTQQPAEKASAGRAKAADAPPVDTIVDNIKEKPAEPVESVGPTYAREPFQVRNGETLSLLLKRAGFDNRQRHDIAASFAQTLDMRKIRPGQRFVVARPTDKPALGQKPDPILIETRHGFDQMLTVVLDHQGNTRLAARTVDTVSEIKAAEGVIEDSLFLSANRANIPLDITIAIANIYAFSVDFQRDLRAGDRFRVLYRERYAPEFDDREVDQLVYATLTLRGTDHDAIWYVDSDGKGGYFDRNGASARRALLKTPVDGARLTSRYGLRRHPILGYQKMHRGLDFGAPRGTPVKAAGDGVIETATRDRINGNFIRIRHGNGYKTGYAHLHRLAKGMRPGREVAQGDVIGYVGSTGRATGPHLHYVVYKSGRKINPSTLKLPRARQLAGAELDRFRASAEQLFAAYEKHRQLAATPSGGTSGSASR